jgi:hypothetical protein
MRGTKIAARKSETRGNVRVLIDQTRWCVASCAMR